MPYDDDQRRQLLGIAHAAVAAAARGHDYQPPQPADPDLQADRAAFVTLKRGGQLRGCIGFVQALYPLYETIARAAAAAAVEDPRFPPVRPAEVPSLSFEISVLTPPVPVSSIEDIEVGRHGLIARLGHRSGLLLPQVPVECGWGRDEFLGHTCLKAGLPANAWQNGADLFCFEAEVFGEE